MTCCSACMRNLESAFHSDTRRLRVPARRHVLLNQAVLRTRCIATMPCKQACADLRCVAQVIPPSSLCCSTRDSVSTPSPRSPRSSSVHALPDGGNGGRCAPTAAPQVQTRAAAPQRAPRALLLALDPHAATLPDAPTALRSARARLRTPRVQLSESSSTRDVSAPALDSDSSSWTFSASPRSSSASGAISSQARRASEESSVGSYVCAGRMRQQQQRARSSGDVRFSAPDSFVHRSPRARVATRADFAAGGAPPVLPLQAVAGVSYTDGYAERRAAARSLPGSPESVSASEASVSFLHWRAAAWAAPSPRHIMWRVPPSLWDISDIDSSTGSS